MIVNTQYRRAVLPFVEPHAHYAKDYYGGYDWDYHWVWLHKLDERELEGNDDR